MASERAKALAEKQKAEKRAEKERRKSSTNPADWSRWRQIREVYKITAEYDKAAPLLMGGAFALSVLVLLGLGIWLQPWWLYLVTGVMVGVLAAMLILTWRAKGATYKRYAGQAGSAEVAIQMLNDKTWVKSPVITATRQLDVVPRVVGPPGIVLIGEGDPHRVRQLLAAEAKKHESVRYGVKVTQVVMGDQGNQVPLPKLAEHLKKLPKVIRGAEVTELQNRLRALDAMRPKVPLPKGPVPTSTRGARQAMRGR